MYNAHKERGLLIIAVPCNQFGSEEPWPEAEIAQFVSSTYGVTFPILNKQDVKGDSISPLYSYLKGKAPENEPAWNFAKYLLDGSGNFVKFYVHNAVEPTDLLPDIEALLN